jgi:hypothetical protein
MNYGRCASPNRLTSLCAKQVLGATVILLCLRHGRDPRHAERVQATRLGNILARPSPRPVQKVVCCSDMPHDPSVVAAVPWARCDDALR